MNTSTIEKLIYLLLLFNVQYVTLFPIYFDHTILLSSFTDDFFYYLKIAENIAIGEGSTFNGIVDTNGYHPLWLIILTIVVKISFYTNIDVLIFVKATISLIIFLSFYLFYKFAHLYLTNTFWRITFVIVAYFWYARLAFNGMENIITIPLFISFILAYLQNKKAIYLGFLASLVVLSRLDSIVILVVFFSIEALYKGIHIKRMMKLGIGAMLIPLYVMSNMYLFNVLVPVSGMAKSVLNITSFHSSTFHSLFTFGKFKFIFLILYIFSIINYSKFNIFTKESKILYLTAIISIPIYYLQTSLRSDYSLWPWYYYPLLMSFIMLSIPTNDLIDNFNVRVSFIKNKILLYFTLCFMLMLSFFIYLKVLDLSTKYRPLHVAGVKINKFEQNHPGIYAMGDRAGVVGFLLKSPIIQLEGLVMDKNYLDILEKSDNIEKILDEYNVDYYIGTNLKKLDNGCYMVIEPKQSSGFSRQIKSELCWKEVLFFRVKDVSTSILMRHE